MNILEIDSGEIVEKVMEFIGKAGICV